MNKQLIKDTKAMLLSICSRRWKEVWRWDSCYSGICVWSMFPKLFAAKDTHCFAELFIYVISRVANESKVRELLCLQKMALVNAQQSENATIQLDPRLFRLSLPSFFGEKTCHKMFSIRCICLILRTNWLSYLEDEPFCLKPIST